MIGIIYFKNTIVNQQKQQMSHFEGVYLVFFGRKPLCPKKRYAHVDVIKGLGC